MSCASTHVCPNPYITPSRRYPARLVSQFDVSPEAASGACGIVEESAGLATLLAGSGEASGCCDVGGHQVHAGHQQQRGHLSLRKLDISKRGAMQSQRNTLGHGP